MQKRKPHKDLREDFRQEEKKVQNPEAGLSLASPKEEDKKIHVTEVQRLRCRDRKWELRGRQGIDCTGFLKSLDILFATVSQ